LPSEVNEKNASQYNVMTNPYVDNFTSVSGSDIVGVFGHVEFVNLQGISVSVNREVHPIYVMGKTDPVSFVRGKRGVAGSLVTIANDRGSLYDIKERYGVYAAKAGDDLGARSTRRTQDRLGDNALAASELDRLGYQLETPDYADQLPPFDVTLVGRSDSLAATISRVGGIFVVSMGTGVSVDDNSIEQQMTWVALYYEDWRPAGRRNWTDIEQAASGEEFNPFAPGNQGEQVAPPYEGEDAVEEQFNLERGLSGNSTDTDLG
jgi:hypothetical protein